MIKNLKFSTKLIWSFGIIITLLAGGMGIYQYAIMSTTTEFEELLQSEIAINNHAGRVEVLLLQSRRNEKDFLLHKDKKYIEMHKNTIAALIQEAQSIVRLVEQSEDAETGHTALKIIEHAKEYSNTFEDFGAAWERRGLDHESGLQGTFRATIHNVMENVAEHGVEDLYIALLQIRRYEKDYVRTKTETYKQKFLASISIRNGISCI